MSNIEIEQSIKSARELLEEEKGLSPTFRAAMSVMFMAVSILLGRVNLNLRIKSFFGTSENAVKTQVWIAISVYVLVAIIKKRLNLEASLYTILQILSVTIFEIMPLNQIVLLAGWL